MLVNSFEWRRSKARCTEHAVLFTRHSLSILIPGKGMLSRSLPDLCSIIATGAATHSPPHSFLCKTSYAEELPKHPP